MYMTMGIEVSGLTVSMLRGIVKEGQEKNNAKVHDDFSVWFRQFGRNLTNGRKKIESADDIKGLIQGRDLNDRVFVYVVDEPKAVVVGPSFRSKNPSWYPPRPSKSLPLGSAPIGSPSFPTQQNQTKQQIPQRTSPRLAQPEVQVLGHFKPNTSQYTPTKPTSQLKISTDNIQPVEPRSSPRLKQTARKRVGSCSRPLFKQAQVTDVVRSEKKTDLGRSDKGKGKVRKSKRKADVEDVEDEEFSLGVSSEDDWTDLDNEFDECEEERIESVIGDIFLNDEIAEKTKPKKRGKKNTGESSRRQEEQHEEQASPDFQLPPEEEYDTEELITPQGSDDESDPSPTFNPETDFKGKINLTLGLKFDSIDICREVIAQHSIENNYDYFLLNNGGGKILAHCKYRCKCPWDKQHGRLGPISKCNCQLAEKCRFKIYAPQLGRGGPFQIRSMRLRHSCGFHHSDSKVTAKYLAKKYLDDWKGNPDWKLTSFMEKVYRDLGVKIHYSKAWYARARAKFLLYGSQAEEYAMVYQYGFAILKHNPGSSALVGVESMGSEAPHFQRIYICLHACKVGYKKGCRPIIGVDGCHLKGAYPGMILVVSKDCNNNIFPIAWAIVEIENSNTWIWFLEQLMKDTSHYEGEGLTLMSDRQKGLLDAIALVAPKVDVRYCVRHIWANFKLRFSGTIFKEYFWKAAKATSRHIFDAEMGCIKWLSEEAFDYLDAIPVKHWSRHGFTTTAKSNMVLNNICESFNAVLKEARTKPVISCLEWIRRYVMSRMNEKWDGVQKYEGRFMPYVERVLGWIGQKAKDCSAIHSRVDEWEVDTSDDRLRVNLKERYCDCQHFMLTGIPCAHAYACILAKRERHMDYVDEIYSRERYMLTYAEHIRPMPGHKHWDPTNLPKPLPPIIREMPGRPANKKRKKEAGEVQEGKLSRGGKQNKCSNCGQPGHKKLKCKNPTLEKPQTKNKGGRQASNDPWVVNQKKKKEARAAKMTYQPPSSAAAPSTSQTHHDAPPQSSQTASYTPASHLLQLSQTSCNVAQQSFQPQEPRKKMPTKSKKKKIADLND